MSTTFPRTPAGVTRCRTGSLSRGCDSPLSVSPSTSYIDLSRLSGSQQRSRSGWAKPPADQASSQTGPATSKLGFEPGRRRSGPPNSGRASQPLTSGLLKQALQTQLSQSSAARASPGSAKKHAQLSGIEVRTSFVPPCWAVNPACH